MKLVLHVNAPYVNIAALSATNVATEVKGCTNRRLHSNIAYFSVAATSSSADEVVTLREDDVQAILAKYKQGDWGGDTDLNTVPLFRSTEKLATLGTQMFAPDEMARFHDVLNGACVKCIS